MLLVNVFGAILSIPYCYLAGWAWKSQMGFVAFSGLILFIWSTLANYCRIMDFDPEFHINWREIFKYRSDDPLVWPSYKIGFWSWSLACFLPIIMNWLSWIVDKFGNHTASRTLYEHRYHSLGIGIAMFIVGWIIWRIFFYPRQLEVDCKRLGIGDT